MTTTPPEFLVSEFPEEVEEPDVVVPVADESETEVTAVSYTHLDVYKRQAFNSMRVEFDCNENWLNKEEEVPIIKPVLSKPAIH